MFGEGEGFQVLPKYMSLDINSRCR